MTEPNIIVPILKESLLTPFRFRFTLDGKKLGALQNFAIFAGIDKKHDIFVHFDGERLDLFRDENGNKIDLNEEGKIKKYKMSERTASEHDGYIVVKNIELDSDGNPTINLMTLLNKQPKQGETQ